MSEELKEDAEYEEKDITMGRIMSHYSPKWMAYLGIIISIINSFGFPIYGLIYAKLLFVMMTSFLPTFSDDRDYWCGMFLLLVAGIGIFGFS